MLSPCGVLLHVHTNVLVVHAHVISVRTRLRYAIFHTLQKLAEYELGVGLVVRCRLHVAARSTPSPPLLDHAHLILTPLSPYYSSRLCVHSLSCT
jgi:hypothetical protein